MHRNIKNLIGLRFGRLLVISDSGRRNNHREVIWSCRCNCGEVVDKTSSTLSAGKSKSCGCSRFGPKLKLQRKRIDDVPQRRAFSAYRRAAQIREYSFDLSLEEFKRICSLNCHYCGSPPSMNKKTKYDSLLMNGIDRFDNTKGYFAENCVPCCSLCNRMKLNLSVKDFIEHIEKVLFQQNQKPKDG